MYDRDWYMRESRRVDKEISILAIEFDILVRQLSLIYLKGDSKGESATFNSIVSCNDRLVRLRILSMKLAVKILRLSGGDGDGQGRGDDQGDRVH